MPENNLIQVDLCKGLRVSKQFNLGSPLNLKTAIGLGLGSCKPLVATQTTDPSDTNEAILARIDQNTGNFQSTLLSSPNVNDRSHDLPYTQYVAGLVGNDPITASLPAYPYPASPITYTIRYNVLNGINNDLWYFQQQPVGSNPSNLGVNPVGYGIESGPSPALILGNLDEFDGALLGAYRPFHTYRTQLRMPLDTANEPLTLIFTFSDTSYTTQPLGLGTNWNLTFNSGGTNYSGNITLWECRPALLTGCTGQILTGQVLSFDSGDANGPSLHRAYCYQPFETLTFPGYGGDVTRSYTVNNIVRHQMVIYATSTVDSITCNGTPLTLGTGSCPDCHYTAFNPPNIFSFPKVFVGDFDDSTTSYNWVLTGLSQTFTMTAQSIGPSGRRYLEGFCRISTF